MKNLQNPFWKTGQYQSKWWRLDKIYNKSMALEQCGKRSNSNVLQMIYDRDNNAIDAGSIKNLKYFPRTYKNFPRCYCFVSEVHFYWLSCRKSQSIGVQKLELLKSSVTAKMVYFSTYLQNLQQFAHCRFLFIKKKNCILSSKKEISTLSLVIVG